MVRQSARTCVWLVVVGGALTACGGGEVTAPKPPQFVSVSAGSDHTCGVTSAGAAYCWGYNGFGQLGNGTTTGSTTPVAVSGGLTFAAVSVGGATGGIDDQSCGITRAGMAYCWGSNTWGALGAGTSTLPPACGGFRCSTTPVAVSGGITFVAVSAGATHTCGLTATGAAYCWGQNVYGALGNGTTADTATPVAVSGGLTFASLSSGQLYTCALTPAGAAYCWGFNLDGQLGDGTTTNRWAPVAVSGGVAFAALVGGGAGHTCGLTAAGVAYCWGDNGDGELGTGTSTPSYSRTPVVAASGLAFASLSAGGFHTCGVTRSGAAYCWGQNSDGELGDGTTTGPQRCQAVCSTIPIAVSGGLSFAGLSLGGFYSCGVSSAGTAYCWGGNRYGELGNGTTTGSAVPMLVGQ